MKDVFISYKAEEFDEANWVKTTLETNGISCWMAPMCIPGGSSYAVEIPQAIRECKVFVLLLSEKSQRSKWVPRELDQAINAGKTVLPFMLENCSLKDDFNFYLTNVQRYAAYESKTKAIEKMVVEIKAILGIHNATPDQEESSPKAVNNSAQVPEKQTVAGGETQSQKGSDVEPVAVVHTEQLGENFKKTENKSLAQKEKLAPQSKKQSKKKPLAVFSYIIFVVALIVIVSLIITASNTVVISGEKFKKNDYAVYLEDAELTKTDISNFSKFKDLSKISLTNCTITTSDISDFSAAESILVLNNCGLTKEQLNSIDFESSSIYTLEINDNPKLSDLSMLSVLGDKISSLSINNCGVADISFIKGFEKLNNFSAANNSIEDISPLANCKEMTKLTLSNNEISDIAALESLISITDVYLDGNRISDLSGLKNTTILSTVDLSNNKISDVSILENSKEELKYISVSNNKIADISPLEGCVKTKEIYADGNKISDLIALSKMSGLEKLFISNNEVRSVEPIKSLKNLYEIDLSENKIKSVDFAANSTDYHIYLDLSNNEISELALPGKYFKYLALYGNDIADLSALDKTSGADLVFDYKETIDFEELSKVSFNEFYIIDCPLNQQIKIENMLGKFSANFVTLEEFLNVEEGESN